MDTFVEQIVPRKKTVGQMALIVLFLVLALLLSAGLWLFLSYFSLLPIFAIFYGAWWLSTTLNREVEYSITNGDVDIDEIIARRQRRRLVSVKAEKIQSVGRYSAEQASRPFDRRVMAAPSEKEDGLWFFTYHSKKRGNTIVIFQPDDRVLNAFLSALPKLLQLDMERALKEN